MALCAKKKYKFQNDVIFNKRWEAAANKMYDLFNGLGI